MAVSRAGKRLRICTHCGKVILQHTACSCKPEATKERNASYDRLRDPWEVAFRRSAAWRKTRDWVLQRDGHLCQHHALRGVMTTATEVHHIVPLWKDRSLALTASNLVSLCYLCHRRAEPPRPRDG